MSQPDSRKSSENKKVFELDDETLIIDTINKLDKEHLYTKAITNSDLPAALKQSLVDKIDEVAQLKKLSKKLAGDLLEQVETKITTRVLFSKIPLISTV